MTVLKRLFSQSCLVREHCDKMPSTKRNMETNLSLKKKKKKKKNPQWKRKRTITCRFVFLPISMLG